MKIKTPFVLIVVSAVLILLTIVPIKIASDYNTRISEMNNKILFHQAMHNSKYH